MAEFKLDIRQNKTPTDVVRELNNEYQTGYKKLIDAEKITSRKLAKEAGRCRRYGRFLSFRRLVFLLFLLFFMASSLMYSGFAVYREAGLALLGSIALTLIIDLFFLILAIFRRDAFKTVFERAQLMLVLCAITASLLAAVMFNMISYYVVSGTLLLVLILNRSRRTTRLTGKSQIFPALISFAAIAVSVLCILGKFPYEDHSIHHERELHSRFAIYDILDIGNEKTASLFGVMLTAEDLIPYGEKDVYEVPATVKDNIKVTAISAGAFRDTASIHTVVLPESVDSIYSDAFADSAVRTVEVHHSGVLYIADGFEGSSVRNVRLFTDKASSIVIGSDCIMPEDLTFFVPEELVWDYRLLNSDLADRIVALQN